ncbi:hypothetical protein GP475_08900 [Corynebacterium poyangense]|uniref:Pentapeptide repeat-containing protein n=1 Tax=Corynebacterium poyangense TaxID=2684405 RepID=A0A7H0SQB9_9CORY|nr:pentapeptide repeat-containing protein [Corynebacterium poyangense]QNQ90744.1 hypothetical protein GP475_08900 [Corynebacterium poyangense]
MTWTREKIKEYLTLCNTKVAQPDLRGEDLSDLYLTGINFFGANLRGANLSRSILNECSFINCDLSGADLSKVNAISAHFTHANLDHADLTWANFKGADFYLANLTWAFLDKTSLELAKLNALKIAIQDRFKLVMYPTLDGWMIYADGELATTLEILLEIAKGEMENRPIPGREAQMEELLALAPYLELFSKKYHHFLTAIQEAWSKND